MRSFGYISVVLTLFFLAVVMSEAAQIDIDACGRTPFDPRAYLKVATALQAMPRDRAVKRLRGWASTGEYEMEVAVLCRMLFQGRRGKVFRGPGFGGTKFIGKTSSKDWPLAPIVIVDGIPFAIARGYDLFGVAEPVTQYLDYCLAEADWNSFRYRAASSGELEQGLNKLLEHRKFRKKISSQDYQFLEAQIR